MDRMMDGAQERQSPDWEASQTVEGGIGVTSSAAAQPVKSAVAKYATGADAHRGPSHAYHRDRPRAPFDKAKRYAMAYADAGPVTGDQLTPEALLESESVIESLCFEWIRHSDPIFDFSIVRRLADRNRKMNRELELRGVTIEPLYRMGNHLPYGVVHRGIAAMQRRNPESVSRAVNRGPKEGYRERVTAEYSKGRYSGTYVGIDLETTGGDPLRGYIINTGWEYMELAEGAEPWGGESHYSGLPGSFADRPIPFEEVHHITWRDVCGKAEFRDDKQLQSRVLDALMSHPYMAHNAAFEHCWFMYFLDGYAEAFKAGKILPIDTREICRKLDDDVRELPADSRPASLENWARRRGTLSQDGKEKHLGLADSDLMLRTVLAEIERHHLLL